MATDWGNLLGLAAETALDAGGRQSELPQKLAKFETAIKVILVASVIGAITGTFGLIVGLARK